MVFLMYHRTTRPTGRLLSQALRVQHGSYPLQPTRIQTLIRWGSATELALGSPMSTLNSMESIRNASDKLRALRLMESAGVTTPPFSPTVQGLQERIESSDSTVVLGRRRHGSQGRDLVPLEILDGVPRLALALSADRLGGMPPQREIPQFPSSPSEFYTQYIPNTREYRVHVFRDEVIRIQGKYLDHPEQHTNPYMKNHGQGFRFRAPNVHLNASRLEMAKLAVRALGLDFGAVDLLIGEDRQTYVLEVNTAPACSPLTMQAYVDAFANALRSVTNE